MNKKVSIIIPFAAVTLQNRGHLNNRSTDDLDFVILTTIEVIKNINNVLANIDKEILLVDNTHNFPNISMPNLKIIKGWQGLDGTSINDYINQYDIDYLDNHTMWASMAYNAGIEQAMGDYIILQHNDIFYHENFIEEMIETMREQELEYITADFKRLSLSGYIANKKEIDSLVDDIEFTHYDGGYLKTKKFGVADAYFFLTKKSFFNDYYVDWKYGDTNHGATIKCLKENKKFLHLQPFYDNPNFKTDNRDRTYKWNGKRLCTHLKGGFSEAKMTNKENGEFHDFFNRLINLGQYD